MPVARPRLAEDSSQAPDLTPDQLELLQDIRDYELELAYSHWNQPPGEHEAFQRLTGRAEPLAGNPIACHTAQALAYGSASHQQPSHSITQSSSHG